ncbi:hypothetical protein [Ktedonospora formicarum]|uniref:Uncharacterized protein n=1 Tax=Ktedonospora formicarum TaxID=2778364 RepID=A0A8J3I2J9_9CHLR|nr:hypothetical protein [Ktedonospora formicarum]GHO47601.1 hypothetical protein KSX_57640 [Ktedonospora formicarum]
MSEIEVAPCPKCEENRTTVEVLHGGLYFNQPKKNAGGVLGLGGENTSSIQALVCSNCGYAELDAVEPDKLIPD